MSETSGEQADILIVDDTPANLNVLSAILSKRGYRVRAAPNGQGALKTARRMPPDLILLDIQMPDMNGYEVCRALKSDAQTRHVPVIFISALDDALDKVEAFQAGGVDYVSKPFQNQLALRRQRETIASLNTLSHHLQPLVSQLVDGVAKLRESGDAQPSAELLALLDETAQSIQVAVADLANLTGERASDVG
jgi:CheY-like chemotaxis protein